MKLKNPEKIGGSYPIKDIRLDELPQRQILKTYHENEIVLDRDDIEWCALVVAEPPILTPEALELKSDGRFRWTSLFLLMKYFNTGCDQITAANMHLLAMRESQERIDYPRMFVELTDFHVEADTALGFLGYGHMQEIALLKRRAFFGRFFPKHVENKIARDWERFVQRMKAAKRGEKKTDLQYENPLGVRMDEIERCLLMHREDRLGNTKAEQLGLYKLKAYPKVEKAGSLEERRALWNEISQQYPLIAEDSVRMREFGMVEGFIEGAPSAREYLTGVCRENPLGSGLFALALGYATSTDFNPVLQTVDDVPEVAHMLFNTLADGMSFDAAGAIMLIGKTLEQHRLHDSALYQRELAATVEYIANYTPNNTELLKALLLGLAQWACDPHTAARDIGAALCASPVIHAKLTDSKLPADAKEMRQLAPELEIIPTDVLEKLRAGLKIVDASSTMRACVAAEVAAATQETHDTQFEVAPLTEKLLTQVNTATAEHAYSLLAAVENGDAATPAQQMICYTRFTKRRDLAPSDKQYALRYFAASPLNLLMPILDYNFPRIGRRKFVYPGDPFSHARHHLAVLEKLAPIEGAAFKRDLGRIFTKRRDFKRPDFIPLCSGEFEDPFDLGAEFFEGILRSSSQRVAAGKYLKGKSGAFEQMLVNAVVAPEKIRRMTRDAKAGQTNELHYKYWSWIQREFPDLPIQNNSIIAFIMKREADGSIATRAVGEFARKIAQEDPLGHDLTHTDWYTNNLTTDKSSPGAEITEDVMNIAGVAAEDDNVLMWLINVAVIGLPHNAATAVALLGRYIRNAHQEYERSCRLRIVIANFTYRRAERNFQDDRTCALLTSLAINLGAQWLDEMHQEIFRAALIHGGQNSLEDLPESTDESELARCITGLKEKNPLLHLVPYDALGKNLRPLAQRVACTDVASLQGLEEDGIIRIDNPLQSLAVIQQRAENIPSDFIYVTGNKTFPAAYEASIARAIPHNPGSFRMRFTKSWIDPVQGVFSGEYELEIRDGKLVTAFAGAISEKLRELLQNLCLTLAARHLTGTAQMPVEILTRAREIIARTAKLFE